MKFQVEDDEGMIFDINLARKGLRFSLADSTSDHFAGVTDPGDAFSPADLLEAGVNYKATGKLDMGFVSKVLPTIGNLVSAKPTLALSLVERVLDYKTGKDVEKAVKEQPEPTPEPDSTKALKDQVHPVRANADTAKAPWISDLIKHSAILDPTFSCHHNGKMFVHDYDLSKLKHTGVDANGRKQYPNKIVFVGMDSNDNVIGYTDTALVDANPLKIENTREEPADMSDLSYFWAVRVKNHVEPVERSIVAKK